MSRQNFYVSKPADAEALILAAEFSFDQLGVPESSELWIVTETKAQLRHTPIEQFLGEFQTKVLAQGRSLVSKGKPIRYYSSVTLPRSAPKAVILLLDASLRLVTRVDGLNGTAAMIVVPWLMEDVQGWIDAHGPTDILTNAQASTAPLPAPIVVSALKSLLTGINVSTGLAHPRDKDKTIDLFRILKKAKIPVDAEEVRAWLIQQKLKPTYADEIASIARDPSKVKKSSSGVAWAGDIISQWKTRSEVEANT